MITCKVAFIIVLLIQVSRAESSGNGVLYDLYPFVRVYRNGTVERFFGTESVAAGVDPATGVRSKDVKFSQNPNLSARIYLPEKVRVSKKLPLLVYIHGGAFFTGSASDLNHHRYLNSLVDYAGVLAVSVNYRLAPEYPLPAGFQDSWLALKWVISHFRRGTGKDPWLRYYADPQRIFLGGDSAGATLAHNMAIRIGVENPNPGVKFRGMFLNCPFFAGQNTAAEVGAVWGHAYPNSKNGLNNPLINPGMDPNLKLVGVPSVVVFVAGDDPLKGTGLEYGRSLVASGWKGQVLDVDYPGEPHAFNLNQPNSEDAFNMRNITAGFLNS